MTDVAEPGAAINQGMALIDALERLLVLPDLRPETVAGALGLRWEILPPQELPFGAPDELVFAARGISALHALLERGVFKEAFLLSILEDDVVHLIPRSDVSIRQLVAWYGVPTPRRILDPTGVARAEVFLARAPFQLGFEFSVESGQLGRISVQREEPAESTPHA